MLLASVGEQVAEAAAAAAVPDKRRSATEIAVSLLLKLVSLYTCVSWEESTDRNNVKRDCEKQQQQQ